MSDTSRLARLTTPRSPFLNESGSWRERVGDAVPIPLSIAAGSLTPQSLLGQDAPRPGPPEYPPFPPGGPQEVTPRRDRSESVSFPFKSGDELDDPDGNDAGKWVIIRLNSQGLSYKSEDPDTIKLAQRMKELMKEEIAGLITNLTFDFTIIQPGPQYTFTNVKYSVKKK
jgi:hypothetical protein